MRKKVGYGVVKARFDVPIPCTIRRILVRKLLVLSYFFSPFTVTHTTPCRRLTYAVVQLGRWSISKNGYERFLFSRSLHSPPPLKAASAADFA
jgi:hypothetical protein